MKNLADGSQVFLRREDAGYAVEHYAPNGSLADRIECESFLEARAVFAEHPEMW